MVKREERKERKTNRPVYMNRGGCVCGDELGCRIYAWKRETGSVMTLRVVGFFTNWLNSGGGPRDEERIGGASTGFYSDSFVVQTCLHTRPHRFSHLSSLGLYIHKLHPLF